ncbi:hypothetical protein CRENBAI_014138, partial [Crenichthys baileyi]
STADGQIIFFPFAKEAKGRRLTPLPEVNRECTLTSNFPPSFSPPHAGSPEELLHKDIQKLWTDRAKTQGHTNPQQRPGAQGPVRQPPGVASTHQSTQPQTPRTTNTPAGRDGDEIGPTFDGQRPRPYPERGPQTKKRKKRGPTGPK